MPSYNVDKLLVLQKTLRVHGFGEPQEIECERQANGVDCGIHVIQNLQHVVEGHGTLEGEAMNLNAAEYRLHLPLEMLRYV